MFLDTEDAETKALVLRYVRVLALPTDKLRVTTDRATYAKWLGRPVKAALGGAYVWLPRKQWHAILINLPRIDRAQPKALEVVVAEELVHMRDRIDGDRRRHAKHGYDRIAHRVAELTGASLEDVRSCLLPSPARPPRYLYACPVCGATIRRRVKGTWSCGKCSRTYDPRFRLLLIEESREVAPAG